MSISQNLVLINSTEIIGVVRRTLSRIDPKLVNHGERVAYIASNIYTYYKNKNNIDFSKLIVLCLLHDIGAYKTDEINDMVKFETENPFNHALFGYVFLKNTTGLAKFAEALLYHHTDYQELKTKNCEFAEYAEIIFLADRADILLNSNNHDFSYLKHFSGTKFNPKLVEALYLAEQNNKIFEKIISGEYENKTEMIIDSLHLKQTEVVDYLRLLVYAIDFRSPYTVTHTADTMIISIELGKLLGLNERELELIRVGSFLHDIGKIAIPNDILEKRDKLTNSEYEIIKSHIVEGENILCGIVSKEICDIALRHHEKIDGSGYPHGLKGNELTLLQRIVAVSDIFSALTQERSYKEPFPKEKVIAILKELKDNNKLCPIVVNTICNNYDLLIKNAEKNHDPIKSIYNNLLSEYNNHLNISNKRN